MKLKTVKIGCIVSGVIVALLMTGIYFIKKSRENTYISVKNDYLTNPSQQNKDAYLSLIKEQDKSVFSKPFNGDNKEDILLTAIKEKDYDFINYLISYFPHWFVSQVGYPSFLNYDSNSVNYLESYKNIGKNLSDLDSNKLSYDAYNIKIAYAINTMPIRDFYQKYSNDILNNTEHFPLASYIQSVFFYLGCKQERLAWKTFSMSNAPAPLNKYELPEINAINQNEFLEQKADLLNSRVPKISSQCKQRLENSGSVILKFANGSSSN